MNVVHAIFDDATNNLQTLERTNHRDCVALNKDVTIGKELNCLSQAGEGSGYDVSSSVEQKGRARAGREEDKDEDEKTEEEGEDERLSMDTGGNRQNGSEDRNAMTKERTNEEKDG
jgi:hypothetical protein